MRLRQKSPHTSPGLSTSALFFFFFKRGKEKSLYLVKATIFQIVSLQLNPISERYSYQHVKSYLIFYNLICPYTSFDSRIKIFLFLIIFGSNSYGVLVKWLDFISDTIGSHPSSYTE